MRTIVDLPTEQLSALSRFCEENNISRAEAVRRAVDKLIKDSFSPKSDVGFGIWKDKKLDSQKYVDNLRNEWNS